MGSRFAYALVVLSLSITFVSSAEARTPAGRGASEEHATAPATITPLASIPDTRNGPVSLSHLLSPVPAPASRPLAFGSGDGVVCLLALEDLRLRVRVSIDGGATFSDGFAVLGTDDRRAAFHYAARQVPSGRIYVAAITADPGGGRAIEVVHSDDFGRTWSAPSSVPNLSGKDPDQPQLAFDATSDGRIAIAWTRWTWNYGVYAVASADEGATWSSPATIQEPNGINDAFLPAIAIDAATGRIHVAFGLWSVTDYYSYYVLHKTESDDGGSTWAPVREYRVPEDQYHDFENLILAPTSDGGLLLAANIYDEYEDCSYVRVLRSVDGGITFAKVAEDFAVCGVEPVFEQTFPTLTTVPGSPTVVLTHWSGACCYPDYSEGPEAVLRSGDNGATWSTTSRLGANGEGYDGWWPRSGALRMPSGTWVVTWPQSGAVGTTESLGIWISRSDDDAASWSVASRISPPLAAPAAASKPTVAVASPDRVLVAYEDTRESGGATPSVHAAGVEVADLVVDPDRVVIVAPGSVPPPTPTTRRVVASDGSQSVYAVFTTDGNELYVTASRDRGRTFGTPIRLEGAPKRIYRASLAAAPNGMVYVACSALDPSPADPSPSNRPILLFRSEDFGTTWTETEIARGISTNADPPLVLAGSEGMVLVAWSWGGLSVARSVDGGRTLDVKRHPVGSPRGGTLAICSGGGRVMATWEESTAYGDLAIVASTSDDWGATFQPAATLQRGIYDVIHPTVACSAAGTSLVAWPYYDHRYRINTSRFDGISWFPLQRLPEVSQGGAWGPRVAFGDVSGEAVTVAFEDLFPNAGVWAIQSADGGATFGPGRRLDASVPDRDAESNRISIVADGTGRMWASWYDNGFGAQPSILVARSSDAGASWSVPLRLDHESPRGAFLNTDDTVRTEYGSAAALAGAGVFSWFGQNGTSTVEILVGVDDLMNQPPIAKAGPDQVLECTGNLQATSILDGSTSTDPDSTPGTNDDIVRFDWSEGGASLATGVTATVPFHLGVHDITLTVTDKAGSTGVDDTVITVRDTIPPVGVVTNPRAGRCFGPSAIPVMVTDSFQDICDPTILRTYSPGPGPTYSTHGDQHVVVTAMDTSGNSASVGVDFTIDTVAPVVQLLSPPQGDLVLPRGLPFNILFEDSDDDGASGGVVHEVVKLQGCPIYDGATYGNADGLLSDETLQLNQTELCRIAAQCGFTDLVNPELRVEATDCGGNVGFASQALPGSIRLLGGICGRIAIPPTRSVPGSSMAPRGSSKRRTLSAK